ncbi:MAG: hypothetical protein E6J70_01210, partial [Deltaproteobacteria bacterium]
MSLLRRNKAPSARSSRGRACVGAAAASCLTSIGRPSPPPQVIGVASPVLAPSHVVASRHDSASRRGQTGGCPIRPAMEGLHMRIRIRTTWLARILGRAVPRVLLAALAGGALLSVAPAAHALTSKHPILFVHGIEGSGAQFESQAMRFESNGYAASWIDEVDYNSTRAVGDKSEVDQQIDAAIAALKQQTGKSQVDVVAHSLGTSVMYDYLTNGGMAAQRRANVAHYINVDGQNQNPGVPTLAVWAGRGTPGRNMDGAQNVTIPDQTHVQTCTSAESFIQYFEFLRGGLPGHDIVPRKRIQLAGKALNFPQNAGLAGATVQIWPVGANGVRTTTAPLASIAISDGSTGGGAWGPVAANADQRYEFALVQTGLPTLHLYYEPFVRS